MNVTVTGCKDCPFDAYTDRSGYFCFHPNVLDSEINVLKQDDNYESITPEWCPLNKEPITIEKV